MLQGLTEFKVQGCPASNGSSQGVEQGNEDGSHAGHATRECPKESRITRTTNFLAGTGADMMKRVAAPMIGGLVTSFIMELLVYPPIYEFWKWNFEMRRGDEENGKD